eukprot:TRINITY_DN20847_c0_g1_i1.p1 TRINITY_DN20847_c0_g1~~TRINITY_DN20847_c0_g1_i1.p1  ORF type:complete len:549 (+),score=84.28 TRINITY_DN20847_c0_g1_i1:210-1856(+)
MLAGDMVIWFRSSQDEDVPRKLSLAAGVQLQSMCNQSSTGLCDMRACVFDFGRTRRVLGLCSFCSFRPLLMLLVVLRRCSALDEGDAETAHAGVANEPVASGTVVSDFAEFRIQLDALQEEVRSLRLEGASQREELLTLRTGHDALELRLNACGCSIPGDHVAASPVDIVETSASVTVGDDGDDDGASGGKDGPGGAEIGSSKGTFTEGDDSARSGADAEQEGTFEAISDLDSHLVRVNFEDEEWVKEVFFGGQPWVVHCLSSRSGISEKAGTFDAVPPSTDQVPEAFLDAALYLRSMATFGTIACWERLPSGKTLAQRFNLPKPPVTFAVANGDPPLLFDLFGVSQPQQLRRKVDMYLAPQVTELDGLARFKQLCSRRRACLVVSFQTMSARVEASKELVPLLAERRGVRAVALDAASWQLRLEERLSKTKPILGSNQAGLLCLTRGEGSRRGGEFFRYSDGYGRVALDAFLERCEGGRVAVEISETPWISHRERARPRPQPTPRGRNRGRPHPRPRARPGSSREAPSSRRHDRSTDDVADEDVVEL